MIKWAKDIRARNAVCALLMDQLSIGKRPDSIQLSARTLMLCSVARAYVSHFEWCSLFSPNLTSRRRAPEHWKQATVQLNWLSNKNSLAIIDLPKMFMSQQCSLPVKTFIQITSIFQKKFIQPCF